MAPLILFVLALAAADDGSPSGGAAPEPAIAPTTVEGVTVNTPRRHCRKVHETGARNPRTVCTASEDAPPPVSLEVRSLSPTVNRSEQSNINQTPKGP